MQKGKGKRGKGQTSVPFLDREGIKIVKVICLKHNLPKRAKLAHKSCLEKEKNFEKEFQIVGIP